MTKTIRASRGMIYLGMGLLALHGTGVQGEAGPAAPTTPPAPPAAMEGLPAPPVAPAFPPILPARRTPLRLSLEDAVRLALRGGPLPVGSAPRTVTPLTDSPPREAGRNRPEADTKAPAGERNGPEDTTGETPLRQLESRGPEATQAGEPTVPLPPVSPSPAGSPATAPDGPAGGSPPPDLNVGTSVGGTTGNPLLGAARAEARAAEAQVRAARAESKPQVTATGYATLSSMQSILMSPPGVLGPSNVMMVPPDPYLAADAMLMVPFYTGGRVASRVRSARAGAAASASEVAVAEQDVALQVKEAYHGALFARQNVAVFEERVREAAERVRLAEAEFRVGRAAQVEVLRARAERADAEQELTNALRNAELAGVRLKTAMGLPQEVPLELTDTLAFVEEVTLPEERLAQALRSRPELVAARLRVEAAQANVDRAKGLYRPQVYGVAMADVFGSGGMGKRGGVTVGVTVGLPLLDGGMRRAEVEEAQAMLEREQANEQGARLQVEGEVQEASLELAAAARNVALSEAAVEAAQEQYRLAQLRYEVGRGIFVEVLDALTALTRARTNRLQALYEYNVARDRLSRALGIPALSDRPGIP
ncbi:MAG: TolC family protein [Armatimonadetes bacterium]|nr:TolC family protein [Armatimonadota bacterium]